MKTTTTISSLEELDIFAKNFLLTINNLESKKTVVVALSGDLGAGKTTLVQHLARGMGINEIVTSPTFTIMKIYQAEETSTFTQLVHMDAYRIESLEELQPLRFEEIISSEKTLICIEWAEKIKAVLPSHTTYLDIKITQGEKREITISGVEMAN